MSKPIKYLDNQFLIMQHDTDKTKKRKNPIRYILVSYSELVEFVSNPWMGGVELLDKWLESKDTSTRYYFCGILAFTFKRLESLKQ